MCVMHVLKCYENVSLIFLSYMYVWNYMNWWYDMWNEFVHAYECMPENEMYVWCMKKYGYAWLWNVCMAYALIKKESMLWTWLIN